MISPYFVKQQQEYEIHIRKPRLQTSQISDTNSKTIDCHFRIPKSDFGGVLQAYDETDGQYTDKKLKSQCDAGFNTLLTQGGKMDKFEKFEQFGYARTLHDEDHIDNDGNKIVIPRGTIVTLLDLYEKGCIVEYDPNDGIRIDVGEYRYEDLEPVSEEEVGRIVKEEQRKHENS